MSDAKMKSYEIRIVYSYESPYSGYDHKTSVDVKVIALNEQSAINKAKKGLAKHETFISAEVLNERVH